MNTILEMTEHYARIFSAVLVAQKQTPFIPLFLTEEQKMAIYLAAGVPMEFKTIDKDGVLLLLM